MNSQERKEARYQRRRTKRELNKKKRIASCTYKRVSDVGNLYKAAQECARGTRWKSSVQRYLCHNIENSVKMHDNLVAGKDIRQGILSFWLWERGKKRLITTSKMPERVVQKSLAQNALIPALAPTLTVGCSANLKGRGVDYAVKRLKRQLAEYYRLHGSNGYVLLIDFADYFGSINHDVCKGMVDSALEDEQLKDLAYKQIDQYGDGIKGLGLGAEPNQMLAVALPSPIDHYLLSTQCVFASGRYMDDTYVIAESKEDLRLVLGEIRKIAASLKLVINEKKTKIIRLSRGFVFLKRKFSYGENGRVYVRPVRKSITRARRRMKRQAAKVKNGSLPYEQAVQSYQSLRGTWVKMDAFGSVQALDKLFKELYKDWSSEDGRETA